MKEPKFCIHQTVNISSFGYIVEGYVIKQEIHNTCLGCNIRYQVSYKDETYEVWEDYLEALQYQELGTKEKE